MIEYYLMGYLFMNSTNKFNVDSQFFCKTIVEVTYLNFVSDDNTYLQTEFPFPEMKKVEIE
jgi:hypothetical protein